MAEIRKHNLKFVETGNLKFKETGKVLLKARKAQKDNGKFRKPEIKKKATESQKR